MGYFCIRNRRFGLILSFSVGLKPDIYQRAMLYKMPAFSVYGKIEYVRQNRNRTDHRPAKRICESIQCYLRARRVYAFCLKYTKSRQNAEEIVEDTFVWVWNNRDSIKQEISLKPILFLKTKHLLINAYRKVVNSPIYEDYMDYIDHNGNSNSADSPMEYDEFMKQVNDCIDQLPKAQQQIIRLSKFEQLANKDIAEQLNYSEQTVKNQLSIGLKQLRTLLKRKGNYLFVLLLI